MCLETLEDRRLLEIHADFDPGSGLLRISSDADDQMFVSSNADGHVTVNDYLVPVDGQPLLASSVRFLGVLGGPGDNSIMVSLSRAAFSQLANPISVMGGAGNDWLWRSDWMALESFVVEFRGGAGDDFIQTAGWMDEIFGQDGNDTLKVEEHCALVDGGPGDDLFVGQSGFHQELTDDEWRERDLRQPHGVFARTKLVGIERAHLADLGTLSRYSDLEFIWLDASKFSGNVTLQGSESRNYLYGGKGNDELIGAGGDDLLVGEDGSDRLVGGSGRDKYEFQDASSGAETDTLVDDSQGNILSFLWINQPMLSGPTRGAQVSLISKSIGFTKDRNIVTERPDAFTEVYGSKFDDWILGNSRDNLIEGGGGNDELYGDDGNDDFSGGPGNDLIHGGLGDDKILGGEGNDTLYGSHDNDKLSGGPGDDQLFGGPGDDALTGGPDADIFVPGGGRDTTDGVADVKVFTLGPAAVKLGPGNAPVAVDYQVEVTNAGPDYANNIKVDGAFAGAVSGPLYSVPVGQEVLDPITGAPTGVRVLAPAQTVTHTAAALATRPGIGTHDVWASLGVAYLEDPFTVNNHDGAKTEVSGLDLPFQPPKAKLVTKNAAGDKTGNDGVYKFSKSGVIANGKKAVFTSWATNYDTVPPAVPGEHVFVGDPVMVDVIPSGQSGGNGPSFSPSMSADGRYVAFVSVASDLVSGMADNNDTVDVFVRDMQTGVTRLVSASTAGNATANGDSDEPQISGDGRYVVFQSRATDLVPGFPPGTTTWQVYRADLQTGAIQLVSVNAAGTAPANGASRSPVVNHDGRYVVWSSTATDAVSGVTDTNGQDDFFVRDMTAGTTKLVTVNYQGTAAANGLHRPDVEITPDGAYIAYASYATNLVNLPDPTSFSSDIFVYNVLQGTNRLASISSDGTSAGSGSSAYPVLSSDGRYVAFESAARNLVAGDTGSSTRVYVRDLTQNVTEYGAPNSAGTGPALASTSPSLSGDGRYLAFASIAPDLVDGFVDGNGPISSDVYVRDRQTGKTTLMSVNHLGTASGNGASQQPVISRDGQVVHFLSKATDLVAGILDGNDDFDLFAADYHVAEADTALRYTAPAGGPNRITLRKNGVNLELVNDADSQVLASKALANTTMVVVTGADAADDQLTVDLAAGGFFSLAGGVNFRGGAGGHDTLILRGSVTTVRYDATGASDGFVTAEVGTSSLPIAYTGLEPILDEATAADRFFASWLTANTQIRLGDDAEPNNGRMIIDSNGTGAFESITFVNPTRLLSIAGGAGNDTLTVASLDNGFAAQLWLAGGAGNDVLDATAVSRAVTLDGGPGDDVLRGGTGDTRYDVTPGSRDELYDSGGQDTLAFFDAFAAVTLDLDLQGTDQTIDAGGNKLQINGQIEDFIGSVYADIVWVAPLAVSRSVRAGAALPGETVYDELRVRTHDPGAWNNGFSVIVPGQGSINTNGTFWGVSMWLPPVAVDDHVATQIGTALTIPVAANDTDPEGDPFTVMAVSPPANGTAEVNANGTVTYTPTSGFFGVDRFTYTIQDPLRGSDKATVDVTVSRPPDAVDDAVTNTIVTVAVLANDTDPDGDTLSVTAITQPADGTAVLNANGTITYTPPTGFQGTALIPYTISDGNGGTDTATLTVTVRPVNDPPSFTPGPNQTANANAGPQTVANWATNIVAGPADEASQTVSFFTATDNAALFAVPPAIAPNGTLTYTPAAGASGTAIVLVQAMDDGGTADGGVNASQIAVFTITVLGQRDIELLGFSTMAGTFGQLELTYEVRGAAVPAFEIAFYTSANARFDAGDTERGPRISVTDPALLAVGPHTVTVSGAAYEAFLLDPAVSFFIAQADAGQAVPDETDETNNDLNFMGLYHRPASPAPLLIRGGDDTDRRADEPADTIELTGGAALSVTTRFTAQPLVVPWADVASIRVVTAGGADTIRADASAVALLHAEGGTGNDTLVFLGGGIVCDLTGGVLPRVRGVEWLDIGGSGANRLVLRQAHVLEADGGVLHVRAGGDDTVDFGGGWTLAAPQFIGGEYFNVLNQGGASLRLTGPHPWQNPVNVFDVNNNGAIAPEDVLAVINLINLKNAGPLTVPPTAVDCPPNWYDVTGDDHLTPADVLAVINWINGHLLAQAAGGEGLPASAERSPAFLESRTSGAASDLWPLSDAIVPLWTPPNLSTPPVGTRRLEFRGVEPSVTAWHEAWDRVWDEWPEEFGEEV